MTATPQRRLAHLTLVELLIAVLLLVVAAFFVVRGMQQAKEREQREQIIEALNVWESAGWPSEQGTKAAQTIYALVKAHPQLHDAKNNDGNTPLHVAALYGNHDIAQWLLDHGADIHAKTNTDWTPLHEAAHHGHKELIKLLLAKGADLKAKNNNGETPLDLIPEWARKEVAELLRKHGAKDEEAAPVAPAAEK